MNSWAVLILAIAGLFLLPIWTVKRANSHSPYLTALIALCGIVTCLFYLANSHYYNTTITAYLYQASYYFGFICFLSIVFLFFGIKHEGYRKQYDVLVKERAQRYITRSDKIEQEEEDPHFTSDVEWRKAYDQNFYGHYDDD